MIIFYYVQMRVDLKLNALIKRASVLEVCFGEIWIPCSQTQAKWFPDLNDIISYRKNTHTHTHREQGRSVVMHYHGNILSILAMTTH